MSACKVSIAASESLLSALASSIIRILFSARSTRLALRRAFFSSFLSLLAAFLGFNDALSDASAAMLSATISGTAAIALSADKVSAAASPAGSSAAGTPEMLSTAILSPAWPGTNWGTTIIVSARMNVVSPSSLSSKEADEGFPVIITRLEPLQ